MADVRLEGADTKYAATKVAVLIPVKRGWFRRNGLLVLDQAGTFSLPSGMQETGSIWQETGTQIAARIGLDCPLRSMKLKAVLSDPNGGNLLVCETDPIRATEAQRLAACGTQVLGKAAVMTSLPATQIVKAFFTRPRYNAGSNSMLLAGVITLTSTGTFDSSATCSSAAATNIFSGSSTNSCN